MMAAARLKLAAPLIGKGGALPGRNATAGPWRDGGRPVPLSIAITVRSGLLATAKLSACLNIASPKMSAVSKAAAKQQRKEGRTGVGSETAPSHGLGPSDVPVRHLSLNCLQRGFILLPSRAADTAARSSWHQKIHFPPRPKISVCCKHQESGL